MLIIIIIISIIIIFASIAMSSSRPGRAIRMDGDTLVQQAKDLTHAIEELLQENKDLKETLQKFQGNEPLLTTDLGEQDQTHNINLSKMKELLTEKQCEVESLQKRLAAMSGKKINQDQRLTENTVSDNKPSDLEAEFTHSFKDGERVDFIEFIQRKSQRAGPSSATESLVGASRLACFIFEVSYECALTTRNNFADVSSSLLNSLINRAPSIAFIDKDKPVGLFPSDSSSQPGSMLVQEAMRELMVHVKEAAKDHDLKRLIETVKNEAQRKLKGEGRQSKAQKTGLILPPLPSDDKNRKLAKYMDYCCRFSWRMVTQVPPLKLDYRSQHFDERSHVQGFKSDKKQTSSSQIKCFLWPTLLDCEKRVIAKGEVLL
ncbi:unnamed protein product [Porites lobata]|uniref:Mitochondria-eating protein n=1 Tax=Porites lobata TaxID=104759 RepID=A0ABN8NG92_9CNID|nr:unnamed protein product [Porites lobata]